MFGSQKQPVTVPEIHHALQGFVADSPQSPGQSWLNSVSMQLNDSGTVLKVFFPHGFFAEWFKNRLQKDFESFLQVQFPVIQSVTYHTSDGRDQPRSLHSYVHDSRYSFNNFLYNKKNYLAYMSALELAKKSSIASNPFLLLGDTGTGKSHLLRAIANHCINEPQGKLLGLFSSDELNFLYRTRMKSRQTLRDELYAFDMFILEDIQQLELYPALQEQLIYVLDYFLEDGRLMLFSCSESLKELDFIDPKLRSLLESGLIVQLKKPDLDIRLEYVQRESARHRLNLTPEQILAVARQCKDFQSLYRSLVRLTVHCQLNGQPPREKQFAALMQEKKEQSSDDPDFDSIMETVCTYFQIDRATLFSGKRTKELVQARQIGMYLCRSLLSLSYVKIGDLFGGKDHSTVIHSVKKIKELQHNNQKTKTMLKDLKNRCRHSNRS